MAELESDIVHEIISRVPSLQALDCCKSVSKEWEHLIDDPYFMTSFCQRTNSVSGFFIQGSGNCETRFVSLHDDNEGSSKDLMMMMNRLPRIMASCRQGLLCCHDGKTYSVCKPTTGESQDLPSPAGSPTWETVSVAILVQGSSPLRYKIVRLSDFGIQEGYNSYECKVFDSEAWEWRDAGAIKLPTDELIIKPSPSTVVTAANSVCWLTNQNNVVEFCEPNKSFHKFPLPETIVRSNDHGGEDGNKRLVEYQGRLGLVCAASGKDHHCFELWLKDLGMRNSTWVKKMEFTRVEDSAYPVGFYNSGIALFKLHTELTFYRVEDSSSLRKVEINWLHYGMSEIHVFPFRSDSEPVHLGRSC